MLRLHLPFLGYGRWQIKRHNSISLFWVMLRMLIYQVKLYTNKSSAVTILDIYNLESMISMILSENIEGQYDESAVALAQLYEDTMKDVDAILALVQEFSISAVKDILEATTNMLLDINRLTMKIEQFFKNFRFIETFYAEYQKYYGDPIIAFDIVYNITNQLESNTLWILLVSKT